VSGVHHPVTMQSGAIGSQQYGDDDDDGDDDDNHMKSFS